MSIRKDAIMRGMCPDCFAPLSNPATICCPTCLVRRREQLAALACHGCGGQSCTDEMEAKMSPYGRTDGGANEETRKKQSGARNGMVTRKGEIYGG